MLPEETRNGRSTSDRPPLCHRMPAAARTGQSTWPDHRRHGHRKDRDAAENGGRLLRNRRAGVHGRHQGRPVGHQPKRQHRRQDGGFAAGARHRDSPAPGLPHHAVGRVRRAGPSGARHGFGHGAAADRAHAGPERHADGRAQLGLQDCRRQRTAAAGPQDLRSMLQHVGDNAKQFTTEYGNISAASVGPYSAGWWPSSRRAATNSLASPCSTSTT